MTKRVYIVVEGQTEQEFVNTILAPFLQNKGIYDVRAVLIRTSKNGRGGFVNYTHLENTINGLLKQSANNDFIVTTLVDFFRIPSSVPNYNECLSKAKRIEQVIALEQAISNTIDDIRFFSYIQLHEFEALLFSNNSGFEYCYDKNESAKTQNIINEYTNPEDINTTPNGAPSKRLLAIKVDYDKVIEGNIIASEVGIDSMMKKCPRFKAWVYMIVENSTKQ